VPLVGAVLMMTTGARERLGPSSAIGLLLGLAGVAALVGLDLGGASAGPLAEVGTVAVCYAVGPIILSRWLSDLPSLGVIALSLAAAAVCYAPFAAFSVPAQQPSWKVIASVLTLAVVCTALAFILFFALIEQVGPLRATVITYVNPAVAALLGVTILGESFTLGMAIGFALVLAGSVLATRPTRPSEPGSLPLDPELAASR
jgi:drug/metabolite transporter (DMT)-like permease